MQRGFAWWSHEEWNQNAWYIISKAYVLSSHLNHELMSCKLVNKLCGRCRLQSNKNCLKHAVYKFVFHVFADTFWKVPSFLLLQTNSDLVHYWHDTHHSTTIMEVVCLQTCHQQIELSTLYSLNQIIALSFTALHPHSDIVLCIYYVNELQPTHKLC